MPSDIDFDPSNSDLQIGIEVEYPVSNGDSDYLIGRGGSSNHIQSSIDVWPSSIGGRAVYDGTVGLEVVSDVLDLADAEGWYRDVLEHVEAEFGERYQPTGLMSSGNTAGTHIHLSSISEDKARELARLSEEPWMQVLFCSSIATDGDGEVSWPVFRGGRYCDLTYGSNHYNVVNARGRGHFEWRLPEPMVPSHISVLTEFLRAFEQSTDAAVQYAQEVLDDADDRITSLRRAEAIGMDIDEMPSISRSMADVDPEGFYETVESAWHLPEIYRVELDDVQFYALSSRLEGGIEIGDVQCRANDVLYADSLNPVETEELADRVRRALNRRGESTRETEATEELKKVLEKKKA